MEIRNLYQPFELDFVEVEEYTVRHHKNTFFEMVFVLEGSGVQIINDHRMPYTLDKLFLIFPQDTAGFEVHSTTQFFFIRFNHSYLKMQSKEWIQRLEYIFHNHNHLPGCILKTVTDKPLVRAMVQALILEMKQQFPQQQEVIKQIVNTVITIAARNIASVTPFVSTTANESDAADLLNYIHQNIYRPEELKTGKIAEYFHVSSTYISEYFKAKTGQNIQKYIIHYKLKLIETRLRYTNMQLNEIVYEFGFTDASHFNRIFKKYKGINPSEFRRNLID